jgi:hypothetical protein
MRGCCNLSAVRYLLGFAYWLGIAWQRLIIIDETGLGWLSCWDFLATHTLCHIDIECGLLKKYLK